MRPSRRSDFLLFIKLILMDKVMITLPAKESKNTEAIYEKLGEVEGLKVSMILKEKNLVNM